MDQNKLHLISIELWKNYKYVVILDTIQNK